jgi:hypothetical protein
VENFKTDFFFVMKEMNAIKTLRKKNALKCISYKGVEKLLRIEG